MKNFIYIVTLNLIFTNCVTFNLDLNNLEEVPDGNWVARVNGSWNNWNTGITLSDYNNDGVYTATNCNFSNGEYQYVYVITGDFDNWSNWGLIGNAPLQSECDYNPNDTYANYGFLVSNNDIMLETNAWNCCGLNICDNWEGCNIGALQTDESYLYGRFEVRMKSIGSEGVVSSFFTYNTNWETDLGNLNWNEIDIEMTGNRDNSVQFTTHHPGNPNSWSYGEIIEVGFNPHEDFHDYAFEWTPNSIKWFVDNEQVYEQPYSIVDDLNFSQKIMMNVWPAIWEDWVGIWDNQSTPQHAYYDFVKYYEYTPQIGNYGSNNNFTLLWEDDFNHPNDDIWEDNSSGSFNGNLCEFTPLNTNIYNGHLILSLTDINQQIACNEITGDIDYDYQTNVVDIIFLVNAILYNSNLEICQKLSSDMDFNNILDIVDIISLINYILNN